MRLTVTFVRFKTRDDGRRTAYMCYRVSSSSLL